MPTVRYIVLDFFVLLACASHDQKILLKNGQIAFADNARTLHEEDVQRDDDRTFPVDMLKELEKAREGFGRKRDAKPASIEEVEKPNVKIAAGEDKRHVKGATHQSFDFRDGEDKQHTKGARNQSFGSQDSKQQGSDERDHAQGGTKKRASKADTKKSKDKNYIEERSDEKRGHRKDNGLRDERYHPESAVVAPSKSEDTTADTSTTSSSSTTTMSEQLLRLHQGVTGAAVDTVKNIVTSLSLPVQHRAPFLLFLALSTVSICCCFPLCRCPRPIRRFFGQLGAQAARNLEEWAK